MLFSIALIIRGTLKTILSEVKKTIRLQYKLQNMPPRFALLTIYKASVRPHVDFDDIIYDQTN